MSGTSRLVRRLGVLALVEPGELVVGADTQADRLLDRHGDDVADDTGEHDHAERGDGLVLEQLPAASVEEAVADAG